MGAFLSELFKFGLYKKTQGRIVRQVTFATGAIIVALGCWSLSGEMSGVEPAGLRYSVPLILAVAGWWVCLRSVMMPRFADFLISVEAEMKKVAWPKRRELINASIVVILVIFVMAAMLFTFDLLLKSIPGGISYLYSLAFGKSAS